MCYSKLFSTNQKIVWKSVILTYTASHNILQVTMNYIYTGWRRINQTIQTFNRVYENLHKLTLLTLVACRKIRRQKKFTFKYSAVINTCSTTVKSSYIFFTEHHGVCRSFQLKKNVTGVCSAQRGSQVDSS